AKYVRVGRVDPHLVGLVAEAVVSKHPLFGRKKDRYRRIAQGVDVLHGQNLFIDEVASLINAHLLSGLPDMYLNRAVGPKRLAVAATLIEASYGIRTAARGLPARENAAEVGPTDFVGRELARARIECSL